MPLDKGGYRALKLALMTALAATIAWPAPEGNPILPLNPYMHKAWTLRDGLPQSSALSVVQTRDGYLWVATQEGLARFDGVRFTVFDQANSAWLPHNSVNTLMEGRDGSLWIGTLGGLVRRGRNGTSTFSKEQGLCANNVTGLAEGAGGGIWIATQGGGLGLYAGGSFRCFTSTGGRQVLQFETVHAARSGTVYAGSSQGLYRVPPEENRLEPVAGFPEGKDVRAILEDSGGRLWVGTHTGLWERRQGLWRLRSDVPGLGSDTIYSLSEDAQGCVWAGSELSGLFRFGMDDSVWSAGDHESARQPDIRAVATDREGTVWFGTYTAGVHALMPAKFRSISKRDGLPSNEVRPVFQARDGSMWVGTRHGLAHLLASGTRVYSSKNGLCGNDVRSVVEDAAGTIWVGTYDGGVCQIRGGRAVAFEPNRLLADRRVYIVEAFRDGSVWIGTRLGGAARWDGSRLQVFPPSGEFPTNVRDFLESRSGGVWIATAGGLTLLKDGRFRTFTTRDGLSHDFTYALHEDGGGALWIATYGGGLCRYRDGRFHSFRRSAGLFDDSLFSIVEDDRGRLWMTSNRGLFSVEKSELDAFASGTRKTFSSISYSQYDGMPSSECNGSAHPSLLFTSGGRLWAPTTEGVAVLDFAGVRRNVLPPPVVIDKVVANGISHPAQDALRAPPGNGNLEIQYTALSFLAPERMKFRYKLEGFDRDWVDPGTRREAYYTNLPPGEYRFRVAASNNDGVWNERGASVDIRLDPHFWQTTWFMTLGLLAAAGLVAAGYRLRIGGLRRRERELVRRVEEQTGMIRTRLEAEAGLENRYRDLVENASDAIFSHEVRGRILSMNQAGRRMTGYTLEELQVMSLEDMVTPEGRARLKQWMRQIESGATLTGEFEIAGKSGASLIWEIKAAPANSAGRCISIEAVARDITEHRRSEDLRRAIDAAEQASRAKSVFLANMSHELRTPLNAVIGYSELVQEDALDAGHNVYIPDLERIEAAGRQLLALINDVLDLSKVEAGRMEMRLEECEVRALLWELESTAGPMARRNRNRLVFESAGSPPTIVADRVRFRQSLLNLLSNACKFTEDGTVTLSVDRREQEDANWICWTVRDTGIGIAPDDMGKLFQSFSQVDSSPTRQHGGTGLGLAISQELCKMMGGRITVESAPGEGSAFTAWLPERAGDTLDTQLESA